MSPSSSYHIRLIGQGDHYDIRFALISISSFLPVHNQHYNISASNRHDVYMRQTLRNWSASLELYKDPTRYIQDDWSRCIFLDPAFLALYRCTCLSVSSTWLLSNEAGVGVTRANSTNSRDMELRSMLRLDMWSNFRRRNSEYSFHYWIDLVKISK